METHRGDARAEETPDPWDRFQGELGGLGDRLRETYRRVAAEDGPDEHEIRQALHTLAGAWDQVAASVSSALQDPEVRTRMRDAAAAFTSAVGRTIADLGAELKDEVWRATGPRHDEEE